MENVGAFDQWMRYFAFHRSEREQGGTVTPRSSNACFAQLSNRYADKSENEIVSWNKLQQYTQSTTYGGIGVPANLTRQQHTNADHGTSVAGGEQH